MKLPRDVSGADLIRALRRIGYAPTRQTGSHVRLSHPGPPQHHITVPVHTSLRVGTLAAVIDAVATHLRRGREELLRQLFRD